MDPREAELEATICDLKALEKAKRELASLRHQYDTGTTIGAVNSATVLRLLE